MNRRVGMVPELAAPYGASPLPTTGDPYNSTATRARGDVIEWKVPTDTIEVIVLCEEQE